MHVESDQEFDRDLPIYRYRPDGSRDSRFREAIGKPKRSARLAETAPQITNFAENL